MARRDERGLVARTGILRVLVASQTDGTELHLLKVAALEIRARPASVKDVVGEKVFRSAFLSEKDFCDIVYLFI